MARYAVYYKTSRTVVKATSEHEAYQKVAVLFGIEPTHAHKACRAFFLRPERTINPVATAATTPPTMSKKTTTKKAAKAAAKKPMDIGTKVMKIHKGIKAKEKAAKPAKDGMSGLDAAALVLREAQRPMTAKEVVAEIQERKLAPKLGGKTPHATIYAAIITEIAKSMEPRFARGPVKGTFVHNPALG